MRMLLHTHIYSICANCTFTFWTCLATKGICHSMGINTSFGHAQLPQWQCGSCGMRHLSIHNQVHMHTQLHQLPVMHVYIFLLIKNQVDQGHCPLHQPGSIFLDCNKLLWEVVDDNANNNNNNNENNQKKKIRERDYNTK